MAADGDGNETTTTSDSHSTKEGGSEERATEEPPSPGVGSETEQETGDQQTPGVCELKSLFAHTLYMYQSDSVRFSR